MLRAAGGRGRQARVQVDWTSSFWLHHQLMVWVIIEEANVPVPLVAECAFFPRRGGVE